MHLRKNIAKKYYAEAKRRYGYRFSDEGKFSDAWGTINALIFDGGYDGYDNLNNIITSSAIWILDRLVIQGKMDELHELLLEFPKEYLNAPESIEEGNFIPPFSHPMYGYELIHTLVRVLIYRNYELKRQSDRAGRLYYDELEENKESKSRKIFKNIINLIDENEINRLIKNYEAKIWEFYDIYFEVRAYIDNESDRLDKEIKKAEKATENYNRSARNLMPVPQPMVVSKLPTENLLNLDLDFSKLDPKLRDLHIEQDRKRKDRKNFEWITSAFSTRIARPNSRENLAELLTDILPVELSERIIHFSVEDPFEYAFALFYLLDTRSELPWLYYGSVAVFYTIWDELPLSTMIDEELAESRSPFVNSELNTEVFRLRYQGTKYEDERGDLGEPLDRKYALNISQTLYRKTCNIFPRLSYVKHDTPNNLSDKITYQLATSLMMFDEEFYMEKLSSEVAVKDKIIDSLDGGKSIDTLQETIRSLKSEIDKLNAANNSIESENADLKEKLERFEDNEKEMIRELADLREIVFNSDNNITEADTISSDIKFPFTVKEKIVSFGGHVDWLKSMKAMLPDVTFVSPDVVPNEGLIKNADEIWIQPNCLSHSAFYKIIDIVRTHDIPLRYYIYPGANKCASQLAETYKK